DGGWGGGRRAGSARGRAPRGGWGATLGSEGRRAASDRDAEPAIREAVGRDDRIRRGAQGRRVGERQTERGRRAGEPFEMATPGEQLPVVDAQCLEHTVTGQEPVVHR